MNANFTPMSSPRNPLNYHDHFRGSGGDMYFHRRFGKLEWAFVFIWRRRWQILSLELGAALGDSKNQGHWKPPVHGVEQISLQWEKWGNSRWHTMHTCCQSVVQTFYSQLTSFVLFFFKIILSKIIRLILTICILKGKRIWAVLLSVPGYDCDDEWSTYYVYFVTSEIDTWV